MNNIFRRVSVCQEVQFKPFCGRLLGLKECLCADDNWQLEPQLLWKMLCRIFFPPFSVKQLTQKRKIQLALEKFRKQHKLQSCVFWLSSICLSYSSEIWRRDFGSFLMATLTKLFSFHLHTTITFSNHPVNLLPCFENLLTLQIKARMDLWVDLPHHDLLNYSVIDVSLYVGVVSFVRTNSGGWCKPDCGLSGCWLTLTTTELGNGL